VASLGTDSYLPRGLSRQMTMRDHSIDGIDQSGNGRRTYSTK
jgi:hypothetical protein